MEKQNTKIIKDQKQTRTTIPAKLVKEAGVETGHVAEWELKDGKLSAEIISHEDFMKKVVKANSLPAQTENDAVYNNLTKEEKDAVDEVERLARHDALYTDANYEGDENGRM